ncbi:hypothetical protein BS333_14130 [Vibrio azureus]|uniref:Endonuclease V n=1 Tax=Vibrio azureus NBRC 104587 TaxID=1219077 RepID=U3AMJ4_9VIBR|nr:endonuclease V [Vibrio azureus]AUI87553.1 hypothetical protein BS333_14130 [Vibrio azureus]GAD74522.1 hypothetical protein VAZ01S_012_00010 [Vibrio azureus NBRC 104587]
MYLAIDAQYDEAARTGKIAGILFENAHSLKPVSVHITDVTNVQDYEFGSFYKRELPCIEKLIKAHRLTPSVVIVDGFVDIASKPCLGAKVYDSFAGQFAVIGVAKSAHHQVEMSSCVTRGDSKKPIYVTSIGIEPDDARRFILDCSGKHRIPTMLKLADSFCRMDLDEGVYHVEKMVRGNLSHFEKVSFHQGL